MAYNTGKPVPSRDPRDLIDTVESLDIRATSLEVRETPDRLGISRKTWYGMEQDFAEFLAASGFEPAHLVYQDGVALQVDRPTQLVDYEGSAYRVKMPANFPVVLTGAWATDSALLVDVGDMPLRQDIADAADPAKGAGMVGYRLGGIAAAVGRSVWGKLGESVSVKDFGAVGDGVTDDTAAFQAAINYAFNNGRSVRVAGGRFVCGQLLLPQNSVEPVEAFWIYGENAAILLKTADHLFTVDGDFFYDLFVRDLSFVGDRDGNFAASDSKIFDCGKLMRLNVAGCSSVYVNKFFDCPELPGLYAQSIYAYQCIYRRGGPTGGFFLAPIAFDVSLVDCLVEQSYVGLRVVAPSAVGNLQHLSRVTIRGGAWESLFDTAIAAGPCYQFTVDNVYFEGNGTDINLSYNPAEAPHLAVSITNCDFYQSPEDVTAGKFNVTWGVNAQKAYRTGGNKTNGRLHDTTASAGVFDFTGDSADVQLYSGMDSNAVRVGNSPAGRASFKTSEADWAFAGNSAVGLVPSLGAVEMGRIANADLVNGKVVRPRVAFGPVSPASDPEFLTAEWCRGSYVHNSLPAVLGDPGSQYIVAGWACISSGYAGTAVWVESRTFIGA